MAQNVGLPANQAADIAERSVAANPMFTALRTANADGSVEIAVSQMSYRWWQILIAIVFFPIGLVILAAGRAPKHKGSMVLTPVGATSSTLTGTTGNQALNDLVLTSLGVAPGGQTAPAGQAAPSGPTAPAGPTTGSPVPPPPQPAVAQAAKPDWYPDPQGSHRLRYFDGSQWTEHVSD